MINLNKISVKTKIVGIVLLVTAFTTIVGYFIIVYRFNIEQKQKFTDTMQTNAKLLADYCVGPMNFSDSVETRNILSRIENINEIISVKVFDLNQKLFAEYTLKDRLNKNTHENLDTINVDIEYKDIFYGSLSIVTSNYKIDNEISNFILTNAFWLLLILIIGGFVTYRIQFIITRPLALLATVSRVISEKGDYSIRLKRDGNDEIATVYNAFNVMLTQIQKRDEARSRVEKSLQLAKDRAENADKLKTSFLTNMSHEIRTPMNAILGFTSLLMDGDVPEAQQREYLKVINDSGNSLLNLVNDILDISKIEAGELAIVYENCNINELMNDIFISFQEIKNQKNKDDVELKVNNTIFEKNITINTDPFRLKQILNNLIGNALKFTDNGYIEFGVSEKENSLVFYVEDTGIGISKEHQKIIFERFRKIDEQKSRLFRGAGLGLAISKKLVNLLGGEISVNSIENQGTKFEFSINKVLINNIKTNNKTDIVDLSDKVILIMDGDINNFKHMNHMLQIFNPTIVWAQNSEEASKILDQQTIDITIIDFKVVDVENANYIQQIKSKHPNLYIIAILTQTIKNLIKDCDFYACDSHLIKPVSHNDFNDVFEKITN